MAQPSITSRSEGALAADGGVYFGNGAWLITKAGAPSGTDGQGWAGKGSLLVDTAAGVLYINTGTATSPTWTVAGTQT